MTAGPGTNVDCAPVVVDPCLHERGLADLVVSEGLFVFATGMWTDLVFVDHSQTWRALWWANAYQISRAQS